MNTNSLYKKCPVCKTTIGYKVGELAVYCPFCNKNFAVGDLLLDFTKDLKGVECELVNISLETEPWSALSLLEKFFSSYDWDKYYKDKSLSISVLEELSNKFTSSFENNYESWLFTLKALITPCNKKLEYLKNLEVDILDGVKTDNFVKAYTFFESYKKCANDIVIVRENTLRKLATAYETCKKCNAPTDIMTGIYDELIILKTELDGVCSVELISEIPALSAIVESKVRITKERLLSSGVDIESEYQKAKNLIDINSVSAVKIFSTLGWYKDSSKYLFKLGKMIMIDGVYLELSGKKFAIIEESKEVFDLNALSDKDSKEEVVESFVSPAIKTYSLYEVKDSVPALNPTITGISKVLGGLGSFVYFIKGDNKLCRYDVLENSEAGVVSLDTADYSELPDPVISSDKSKFCIKRPIVISEEKKGCLHKLFRRKKRIQKDENVYSLIEVDMKYGTSKIQIAEFLEVRSIYNEYIVYDYAVIDTDDIDLMVYNVNTGEKYRLPTDDCKVFAVQNDTVIFGEFSPNEFNIDLFAYNFKKDELICLEKNVYRYYGYGEGKVFYLVGNGKYKDLFSININGTSRTQIIDSPNDDGVLLNNSDSFYVGKGVGENAVLLRVSHDGKFKIPVCSTYTKFVSVKNGDIYYVNSNNELVVCSTDGEGTSKIADGVKPNDEIVANGDSVFFLRTEKIENGVRAKSLYRTESNGANVKKLMFNTLKMNSYDDDNLCIFRKINKYFKVSTPINAKEFSVSYEQCFVTEYVKVNKNTFEEEVILTLGSPDKTSFKFKNGCLRKKIDIDTKVEQISRREYIKKSGVKMDAVSDYGYDIVVEEVGDNAVATIKAVRQIADCSLVEAKELVDKVKDGHDTTLKYNLDEKTAKESLEKLKLVGASGYIKNSIKPIEPVEEIEELTASEDIKEDKKAKKKDKKQKKTKKKGSVFLSILAILIFVIAVAYVYFLITGVPETLPQWLYDFLIKLY